MSEARPLKYKQHGEARPPWTACGDMHVQHLTRLEKIAACQHFANFKSFWQEHISHAQEFLAATFNAYFKLFLVHHEKARPLMLKRHLSLMIQEGSSSCMYL